MGYASYAAVRDKLRQSLAIPPLAQERPQDRWNLGDLRRLKECFDAQSAKITEAASLVSPEVLALGSTKVEAFLAAEPGSAISSSLSSGGSDYPYELVEAAGVDLASPAPYAAVATRMNRIMDEIEAILARRGK